MPGTLQRLMAELKRRRVFRVAGVYAIVAWLLIQIADTVLPRLSLPEWTVTLVIVLVLIGFPIAVILSWAFDVTPAGVERTEPRVPEAALAGTAPSPMLRRSAWFVLGILVASSGAWFAVQRDGGNATLDSNMVAVLPFRVSGGPELAYLRDGMLDLLAATLTGDGGPRSSDPRSLLAAWERAVPSAETDLPQEAAVDFARGIGAGQVLLGGIVGSASNFTVTAKILSVPGGRVRAEASEAGGEAELTQIVERLSAKLLTQLAGDTDVTRANTLAGAPLPLLREYLAGRAAYRHGHYEEAAAHFTNVLAQDSTFVLAAMDLSAVYGWNGDNFDERRDIDRRAFALRDRLSPRDLKLLIARVGPNYPAPSTGAERIRAAEEAVGAAPDSPEVWYTLGDRLYHFGPGTNPDDYRVLSRRALERAVALDSAYVGAMIHLAELASWAMDRDAVKRVATAALRADSTGEVADYMRWFLARSSDIAGERTQVREQFPEMSSVILRWIAGSARRQPWDTTDVNDAVLAHQAIMEKATSGAQRDGARWSYGQALLEFGRPAAAIALLPPDTSELSQAGTAAYLGVFMGLGDLVHAEERISRIMPFVRGPVPTDSAARRNWQLGAYHVLQWELANGRTDGNDALLAQLRQTLPTDGTPRPWLRMYLAQVEAMYATASGQPNALADAQRFYRAVNDLGSFGAYNILAARLLEQNGDLEGALQALRREPFLTIGTYDQARLEARLGHRDEAIRAYQKYLLLNYAAEASVQPQVERARAELAALVEG